MSSVSKGHGRKTLSSIGTAAVLVFFPRSIKRPGGVGKRTELFWLWTGLDCGRVGGRKKGTQYQNRIIKSFLSEKKTPVVSSCYGGIFTKSNSVRRLYNIVFRWSGIGPHTHTYGPSSRRPAPGAGVLKFPDGKKVLSISAMRACVVWDILKNIYHYTTRLWLQLKTGRHINIPTCESTDWQMTTILQNPKIFRHDKTPTAHDRLLPT